MRKRVEAVVKALGISGRAFCLAIGVSTSFVRNIKADISVSVLNSIVTVYPQVNIWYIVRGEGPIFVEEEPTYPVMSAEESDEYGNKESYQSMCKTLLKDNQDLRRENKELRDLLMEQLAKNENLLVENTQLKVKMANDTKS